MFLKCFRLSPTFWVTDHSLPEMTSHIRTFASTKCYGILVSISPTFYEQLLRQNPFTKKLQIQIVSTQKLRKILSYEKAARKILVKLPPGRQIERLHRHLKVDMVRVDANMGVPDKEVAKLNHRSNLPLGLCWQHFIFFVTYKWDQSAREFVSNKHSYAQCNVTL